MGLVLATTDLRGIAVALGKTRWPWYLLAQITMISYIGLIVCRWRYLLKLQGIIYPFQKVFLIYNAGSLAGAVTPGRLGDFARLIYFRQENHSIISVTLSIILDRFLDLFILTVIGMAAIFFLPLPKLFRDGVLGLVPISLLLVIGFCLLAWRTWNWDWLRSVLVKMVPLKFRPQVDQGLLGVQDAVRPFLSWRLSWPLILTILGWAMNFLAAYFIARALNLHLGLLQVGACLALTTLFTLIPVSIAGIGTREVSLIFLFSLLGMKQEQALAFSCLLLGLVVTHGLIGWLSLTLQPPCEPRVAHCPK